VRVVTEPEGICYYKAEADAGGNLFYRPWQRRLWKQYGTSSQWTPSTGEFLFKGKVKRILFPSLSQRTVLIITFTG